MSLLNTLAASLAGGRASGAGALLPVLLKFVQAYPGGAGGFLKKLQDGGLADVVGAWLGGQSQPVTGEQLRSAMGDADVSRLAKDAGQDEASVLGGLADLLPKVVSKLAENGTLPADTSSLDMGKLMGGLSGLLRK